MVTNGWSSETVWKPMDVFWAFILSISSTTIILKPLMNWGKKTKFAGNNC
jgi:Kef-type K+ transport system membrane component KefB